MTPKWELYAQGVEDGTIIAGGHIRNAVRRYRLWQERKDIEFRAEQVERVISFFGILHHFKDAAVGKAFILEPWQEFLIACIYGWYYPGTDTRVVNNAYIEVARKNGKTAFAAGLCMYHLVADGVAGAEVDLVANSREQASIAIQSASSTFGRSAKRYFSMTPRVSSTYLPATPAVWTDLMPRCTCMTNITPPRTPSSVTCYSPRRQIARTHWR